MLFLSSLFLSLRQQNASAFCQNIPVPIERSSITRLESSPDSEIGFAMDKLGGSRGRVTDLEAPAQPKRTQQRRLLHNLFDIVAIAASRSSNAQDSAGFSSFLVVAFLIFGLLFLLIKPFRRGFFCDDESIQYPFNEDTIPMWLLGVYGGIGPIIIVSLAQAAVGFAPENGQSHQRLILAECFIFNQQFHK